MTVLSKIGKADTGRAGSKKMCRYLCPYIGLDTDGKFVHKRVKHSAKQFVDGMAHTNGIESVWAVLKRGFYGTFHWFSRTHTQLYLDEVVFRLNPNEGHCRRDTVDRLETLIRGTAGTRLTWKMLVHEI